MNPNIPNEALEFFKKLEKNNDRDWFATNKRKTNEEYIFIASYNI